MRHLHGRAADDALLPLRPLAVLPDALDAVRALLSVREVFGEGLAHDAALATGLADALRRLRARGTLGAIGADGALSSAP